MAKEDESAGVKARDDDSDDDGRVTRRGAPARSRLLSDDDDSDDDDSGDSDGDGRRGKRYSQLSADRSRCRFTRDKVKRIDYKDVVMLQKLMTSQGKILSRKRTGIAARYQRMVRTAIKRARFMALLPYTG